MTNIVVGSPVRNDNLYGREEVIDLIWKKLEGSNILLAAPRRFGKTSIMFNLRDSPREGFDVFYLDVEWIRKPSDFIVEIITELLSKDSTKRIITSARSFPKKILDIIKGNIEEIEYADIKIKLREELSGNWEEQGKYLIKLIEKSQNKVVFTVDEFPVMIHEMSEKNPEETKTFLNWFRSLRISPEVFKNIRFVIGGSIGIERILNKMDSIATINDLEKIYIGEFNKKDAENFIIELFKSEDVDVDKGIVNKILDLIGKHIPYFIQVLVSETIKESRNKDIDISREFVEKVYKEKVLGVECRTYFEHYYMRLRQYSELLEEKSSKAILKTLAREDEMKPKTLYQIYLKAISKTDDPDGFNYLMGDLENDFYIKFNHENETYSFASKILKDWWRRYYVLIE
ncbi:hypothetical protein BEH94_01155 [Candidatus Altiarchaeales archaeon WOR_SM1_SCG]|nr:hypothetical protein BEH94_01155 [Candidatus Altiarchaeales archaeon WOR_SM1_SCG]